MFQRRDKGLPLLVQDAPDLATLEQQIRRMTADSGFQRWTQKISPLLRQTPNREIHLVVEDGAP
ncbi:MAG: hypothetical protein ACREQ2_03490 [Candidatus Binatia bacterium]